MTDININQYKIETEPYYEAQANEVALYEAAYEARLPVMIKGPTGCGKSRFIEYMAWKLKKPLITVACNEDMTASDLVGRYLLDANGTRWLDGPLTTAARIGAICYLDEIVEARQDTTVVIHPLTDHRRQLPLDKKGELINAHPDFQLVISYNPGYQSLMKDLKQSTKQRFTGMVFDYPSAKVEASIVKKETGVDAEIAMKLVKIGVTARNLKGHGLDEGISTRLLTYAATLINKGVDPVDACRMALVRPITDDADIRSTLDHAIDAIMPDLKAPDQPWSLAAPDKEVSTELSAEMQVFRDQLKCSFKDLDDVFGDCMSGALAVLSNDGIKDYLKGASLICMIGRGFEPVLVYLEEMPQVAKQLGESTLSLVSQTVWDMSRSPNGKAIPPFLNTIAEAARRLGSEEQLKHYIEVLTDMMERTTGSVHGFHTSIPSPGLPDLLNQMPYLLSELSLEGIKNWIDYGIRNYEKHPERQKDYFCLQSADSKAILSRERHGTLFIDNERKLDLYLKALWQQKSYLIPYSNAFDQLRKPIPYYDHLGIRVPDVFDDTKQVTGIDRYRAVLAHIAAHQRWTTAIIADNFSPFQRIAIETLEDSRVEYLAMQEYPGLRRIFLLLHPVPKEDACEPEKESCIRHRLAMLSYGILNPDHGYNNADLLECIKQFNEVMQQDKTETKDVVQIAISYIAKTRRQLDQSPKVYFDDTEVDYRDDNRHMWVFIEEGDEEEPFEDNREVKPKESEFEGLPPRHYKEWDYNTKTYRPDWVSLYETLHPKGNAADIDKLLAKHAGLAKQLKHILDLLKPQQYVRVRYQEEGSELDLDVAIRSLIDYKSGAQPDTRINMSHRHDGRDIAVMLLLDLSASLADTPEGCTQTILELSQEAVALLGWAIEHLGDKFAIAGFSSNTRHEVRYQHIKGYSEHWNDDVKARLAAMEAGYSTRMGAALRHAAHYLGAQKAEKKLLLVLTDGEPSDIDVDDQRLLIEDARKAVQELDQDGIYTYCINLDANVRPGEDDYVTDIFGKQYTVIDRIERLPEKLPQLFMALTG